MYVHIHIHCICVFSSEGILVAKKKLFRNKIPDSCGGGTVFYVRMFSRNNCIAFEVSNIT